MTIIEWVQFSVLIVAIGLSITLSIVVLVKSIREGFTRKRTATFILALGLLFIIYLAYYAQEIHPADGVQIMLVTGLVAVTGVYALFTARQADASITMAEEMRKQRVMASRPVIIQKAVNDDLSSHFEIYNAGNGPAIEVEVSLLLQREPPYEAHNCQREGFLRAGDTSINFYTTFPPDVADSTFYIVSEYQGILSYDPKPTWYQTWLPCKLSVSGKVISFKLEFHNDVSEENRIGIFKSEFNNGSVPK